MAKIRPKGRSIAMRKTRRETLSGVRSKRYRERAKSRISKSHQRKRTRMRGSAKTRRARRARRTKRGGTRVNDRRSEWIQIHKFKLKKASVTGYGKDKERIFRLYDIPKTHFPNAAHVTFDYAMEYRNPRDTDSVKGVLLFRSSGITLPEPESDRGDIIITGTLYDGLDSLLDTPKLSWFSRKEELKLRIKRPNANSADAQTFHETVEALRRLTLDVSTPGGVATGTPARKEPPVDTDDQLTRAFSGGTGDVQSSDRPSDSLSSDRSSGGFVPSGERAIEEMA